MDATPAVINTRRQGPYPLPRRVPQLASRHHEINFPGTLGPARTGSVGRVSQP